MAKIIGISINRDTGVRRAIYAMNSGIFNKCSDVKNSAESLEPTPPAIHQSADFPSAVIGKAWPY
jgi:hypothetical protein